MIQPGGIDSYSVRINNTDITASVINFDIFLDIFLIGYTCNINIADGQNLITTLPINQFADVDVYVRTDVDKPCSGKTTKTLKFKVMKITNQRMLNTHMQEYRLVCVSKIIVDDLHQIVSKVFNNSTIYSAVAYIAKNYLNDVKLTGLNDGILKSFTVNKMTPISAIQWLTKFATFNNSPDFIAYSPEDNVIAFDSFENIFTKGAEFKMFHNIQNMLNDSGNYSPDVYNSILSYEVKQFDAIAEIAAGYSSSANVKLDPFNRTFEIKRFEFGDDNSLDKSAKQWKDPDSFKPTNFTFTPTTGSDIYSDNANGRMSALMKLNKHVMTISAYGSVCWLSMLGKIVDVIAPALEDITDSQKDKLMSGNALVTAIRLHVKPNYSRVYIDLTKKRLTNVNRL